MKIAVFRAGNHTDMSGNVKEWTESDLDKIISQYDPAKHEAPAVIGHPQHNTPAWGWVTGLNREGDTLYAEFGQLDPAFVDLLKAGRFKKRSISLYPDLSLKHVGFLGASPPAVKGLPDFAFLAGEETTIEFTEKDDETMDMKEFFEGLKFWKDAVAAEAPAKTPDQTVSFTEADVEVAKKAAVEAERERLTLEFAESAAKAKQEARHATITAELTQMVAEGKAIPAWIKGGLAEFMMAIDAGMEIQFAEDKKQTPLDWFRGFLVDLPKVIEFGEIANGGGGGTGDASGKIEALIKKKMTDKPELKYSAAFAEVQLEHPELVSEYVG